MCVCASCRCSAAPHRRQTGSAFADSRFQFVHVIACLVRLAATNCVCHMHLTATYCVCHMHLTATYCVCHMHLTVTYCVCHMRLTVTYCVCHMHLTATYCVCQMHLTVTYCVCHMHNPGLIGFVRCLALYRTSIEQAYKTVCFRLVKLSVYKYRTPIQHP